jgi:hypothetical protein
MQAAVERVLRSFTLKQPMPNRSLDAVQDDATQFAAALFDNYKAQLAQRTRTGAGRHED